MCSRIKTYRQQREYQPGDADVEIIDRDTGQTLLRTWGYKDNGPNFARLGSMQRWMRRGFKLGLIHLSGFYEKGKYFYLPDTYVVLYNDDVFLPITVEAQRKNPQVAAVHHRMPLSISML